METEMYTADDIAKMCGVTKAKAYIMIRALNDMLIKEKKTPRETTICGRIGKKFFHEKMGI